MNAFTTDEWILELGNQISNLRLRQNITQQRLAERAGVALNVVKRLESGQDITVSSLIKTLRALGRVEWLTTVAPEVSISPIDMLRRKPTRQRASRNIEARNV